uniref:Calcium/proton exchanger n=1 Tax=Tanacetum cinerariifolium TaxID=118510 RepID=A0A699HF39_TANCI|nr:calcium/proton exchanger [Tanacetum cinerariifolium]
MEPILGMRYETAQSLKMALANYGVAHGCQLLYMKNDWRQVLVYCGRNVVEGRCAGKKVVKKPIKKAVKRHVNKKPDLQSRKSTSQSPKWTKKQRQNSKKVNCPFRFYALWVSREQSFQIKSLISEHKRCRNYNLGSLVTYKWIDMQYFKEIIEDTFMPLRKMRDDIRQKLMIDVSVGQCKRAKQLALFDHEGGLIEHYEKLYQYRQALLDSNPGSTCTLDVVESDNGFVSFKRMYIYFKRVKDGWLAGCRKGLIEAVNDWLPEAKHRKCTRHIYANFKKKYSGLQYHRLSWVVASCTLEHQAFFEMDKRCATFENGFSKSFNKAILGPIMKPNITMLEEIRLYIMQRIIAMNKLAFSLEDRITPSIRKRLEILKEKQREWFVFPSGFQELEVRKGHQSYGVSLQHKWKGKRGGGRAGRGSGRGSRGGVLPSLSSCGILTAKEVFSTWMEFGGNTRYLGSLGEETDEITDLHQFHEEILFSERGDGVTGIKRRRRDPSSDGGKGRKNDIYDMATDDDSKGIDGPDMEVSVKEAEIKNRAENEDENKTIKKAKKEEVVEAPSSRPVEYYLKHRINEKLIEGLVDNNRFDDSLSGARVGKEDVGGNFKIPCSVGGLKHVNALVDQGFDVNAMPYSTYMKLTDETSAKIDIKLSLASHSYIYPLGIVEDVLVEASSGMGRKDKASLEKGDGVQLMEEQKFQRQSSHSCYSRRTNG